MAYSITTWHWTPDTWSQEYKLVKTKYLFQDNTNIVKLNPITNKWDILSTAPPTEEMFLNDGMDDMSSVTQVITSGFVDMTNDGIIGAGTQFSCDLVDGLTNIVDVTTS